ncbi:uncharacterized protein LOC100185160 [Ciona intestinalis]
MAAKTTTRAVKNVTLSPAFSKGKSSTLKDVETEYIKNLQQQIYFLELEAEYLRQQTKSATDIHPKMTQEADRMMFKLKDMQSDLDGMNLEISRKDSNISMLTNEKKRTTAELKASEDNSRREKSLFTQEIIQLKKMKEVADRDISLKDSEIVRLQQQLERVSTDLRHEKHSKNLLQSQHDQRVAQHSETMSLLDTKRQECLHKDSEMHYLEEKFNTSTLSMQDKITKELKNEILSLRRELRSVELSRNQDRIIKDKMVENVSKLTQENVSLHTQVLDLGKQFDHLQLMADEKDSRAQVHTNKMSQLRGSEQVLNHEVKKLREMLEFERNKLSKLEAQMLEAQDGMSNAHFHSRSVQSRLDELNGRFTKADDDNVQLRKDKLILVEHIAQQQKQLDLKEAEIHRLESHIYTLQTDISMLTSEIDKSKSMQTKHWNDLSKAAESLKIRQ